LVVVSFAGALVPKSIFLCHSSKDKEFARRLATDLRARGLRVWIDEAEIKVGDSLIGKIEAGLDEADYLGAILSKTSVQSEWVLKELRVAMHREIDGRRVVVLPLLYQDCPLPAFLRDKLYIDFRDPINYQAGVIQIVNRAAADFKAAVDFPRLLGEIPFTRVWQQAIVTNIFSERFLSFCQDVLRAMKGGEKSWDPLVASSYFLFVTEVLQQKEVPQAAWSVLCRLVEDEEINEFLRYVTLDRMALAASSDFVHPREWGLPNVVQPTREETPEEDFFTLCLEIFFDPSKYNLLSTDRNSSVRIFAFLLANGKAPFRNQVIQRISSYMDESVPGQTGLLKAVSELPLDAPVSVVAAALGELRQKWADLESGSLESDRRKIELIFEALLNDRNSSVFDDLLAIFKRVPKRLGKEHHDFEIWMTISRVFTPDIRKIVRERVGEAALYRFLTDVLTDSDIDLEFSILALMSLVDEFGIEGLVLDDRIPTGVLEPRGEELHQYSVAEALCESIKLSAGHGDSSALFVMAALHHALDPVNRVRLIEVIDRCLPEAKKIITDFCNDRITAKKAEKELARLMHSGRKRARF
jgi:hypothetical protein